MNRYFATTIAAASLLVGAVAAPTAFAQSISAPTSTSAEGQSHTRDGHGQRGRHHRGNREMRNATPEERAVLRTMMKLERVYMGQGRINDLKAMLMNLKSKTTNETITKVVDRQLARLDRRPSNPDQVIATMTQQLSDNLAKVQ